MLSYENRHEIAKSTKLAQQYGDNAIIGEMSTERDQKFKEARDKRRAPTQTEVHKKAKARHKRPCEDKFILPRGDVTESGKHFPWPCTA